MGYNDITGEAIRSKNMDPDARKRFEEGFERIFGKKVSNKVEVGNLTPIISDEYKEDLLKSSVEKDKIFKGDFK